MIYDLFQHTYIINNFNSLNYTKEWCDLNIDVTYIL